MVDDREDYGEVRWLTMGWAGPVLLVVAYTLRGADGDIIREPPRVSWRLLLLREWSHDQVQTVFP
jgi:uncharacterized DUF497 family protein